MKNFRLKLLSICIIVSCVVAAGPTAALSKPMVEHSKWSQPPIEIDPNAAMPTYYGWNEPSHREIIWFECWGPTWPYQCHGDADNKGAFGIRVGLTDLAILKAALGGSYGSPTIPPYNPCADFDRNLIVDHRDLDILMDWYMKPNVPADCQPWIGGIPTTGGAQYWDLFAVSLSPDNMYWNMVNGGAGSLSDQLVRPAPAGASVIDPNTPLGGVAWGFGGLNWSGSTLESNANAYNSIELKNESNYYLSVVLDTSTLPQSDAHFPSWGTISDIVVRPWDAVTETWGEPIVPNWVVSPFDPDNGTVVSPNSVTLAINDFGAAEENSQSGTGIWGAAAKLPSADGYKVDFATNVSTWDSYNGAGPEAAKIAWQMVADDFRCLGTMPITSVHWWGSYVGWAGPELPPNPPDAWRISFWSNVAAGVNANYSYPGKLLWQVDISADQVEVQYAGEDYFPGKPLESCFQYYVKLPREQRFWQHEFLNKTMDDTFWVSIAAVYLVGRPVDNPWGWKTRPSGWMDDAVTINIPQEPNQNTVLGPEDVNRLKYEGISYDAAFELDTDPNYIKWEQAYTGIRDWPHYEDEQSMATVDTVVEPVTKWIQPPDLSELGIDVDATWDIQGTYPPQVLADDFICTTTGPITDVNIWGSWLYDMLPPDGPQGVFFTLSLHADIPASQSPTGYSMPGELLWMRQFGPGEFEAMPYSSGMEGYYMPCTQLYWPQADWTCWQYHFKLNPNEFIQQGSTTNPIVYWLDVQAQPLAMEPYTRFGWKTSTEHKIDAAVFAVGMEPIQPPGPWQMLTYPMGHPYEGRPIDPAFEIVTVTQNQHEQFNLTRQVFDDWRCDTNGLVSATVWWGSYIGYRYEAYHGVQQGRPIKPDYFLLSIWTDVPANPGDPCSFSHPGTKIWEYKAEKYDEVLVGYDKHPEAGEQGPGFEPVFRYSVKLPDPNCFSQKDIKEVLWFSVVAVYDKSEPNYPWGWTNHRHVFNDDAVAWEQDPTGMWRWIPLKDQTGVTEDMSFMLLTECFIGGNAGPKEHSDWVAWGKPNCWCYQRQCRGDINGKKNLGLRVQALDLAILAAAFNKNDAALAAIPNGICADITHKKNLGLRVQALDLAELAKYFNKADAQVPSCDAAPLTTGPYNFWTLP